MVHCSANMVSALSTNHTVGRHTVQSGSRDGVKLVMSNVTIIWNCLSCVQDSISHLEDDCQNMRTAHREQIINLKKRSDCVYHVLSWRQLYQLKELLSLAIASLFGLPAELMLSSYSTSTVTTNLFFFSLQKVSSMRECLQSTPLLNTPCRERSQLHSFFIADFHLPNFGGRLH